MRLCLQIFYLIAAITIGSAGVAVAGADSPSESARVDQLFTEWDKPTSPGCALAIVREGHVIYERGYGMADLDHDVKISLRLFSMSRRCQSSLPQHRF